MTMAHRKGKSTARGHGTVLTAGVGGGLLLGVSCAAAAYGYSNGTFDALLEPTTAGSGEVQAASQADPVAIPAVQTDPSLGTDSSTPTDHPARDPRALPPVLTVDHTYRVVDETGSVVMVIEPEDVADQQSRALADSSEKVAVSLVSAEQRRANEFASQGLPVTYDPRTGDMVWIVRPQDTLSGISGTVGVSVDSIAEYNGIKDVDLIYDDSAIRIPAVPV